MRRQTTTRTPARRWRWIAALAIGLFLYAAATRPAATASHVAAATPRSRPTTPTTPTTCATSPTNATSPSSTSTTTSPTSRPAGNRCAAPSPPTCRPSRPRSTPGMSPNAALIAAHDEAQDAAFAREEAWLDATGQ